MIAHEVKLYQLVRSLRNNTSRKSKMWYEIEGQPEAFSTELLNGSITISRSINEEASFNERETVYDYQIRIKNGNGAIVEEFSDLELTGMLKKHGPMYSGVERSPFNEMRTLYEAARRNAVGSEQIIDSLLNELGQ